MSPTGRDTAWVAQEFDRRALTYDESVMHHWQAEQAVRLLRPQSSDRILDIATGTGLAARACARRTGAPGNVAGVDISLGMLLAAARVSTSSYLQADAAQLPFRTAVFDAVLCVAAVPYLLDLRRAVDEWRRVARPGAALVFTSPAADGVTTLRLIRASAATYGLELPDPHADLGTVDRIATRTDHLGVVLEDAERHTLPERLGHDAQGAYDAVLNYGFAEPLRTASPTLQRDVFARFSEAYHAALAAGEGEHAVMFTRCRFSNNTHR